jgi:lipid A 3-O-deacylase PagL
LQTIQSRKTEDALVLSRHGQPGRLLLGCMCLLAALACAVPPTALAQVSCRTDEADRDAAKKAGHPKPVESQLVVEGQGSFGNYQIFAAGEDSKLFSAGVEYDRHSWGCFLGAQVYYVGEILPFLLLDQPAQLNYYGVQRSQNKVYVPGAGIIPIGFQMRWRHDRFIKPYLMAKGGILVFTQKAESPNASYENFTLRSETGFEIRLTSRVDLRMGVGDSHFSNGFVVPSNPGLDVMSYMGGISLRLNK